MEMNSKVIIIGGGLSGLSLAWLLSKKGIKSTVLEASARLGGRIQTVKGILGTPLELGATWFSDMHPNLLALINELGLTKYPQYSKGISLFQTKSFEPPQKFFVPEAESPSYRLAGGTQLLIDTLAKKLSTKDIHLNSQVSSIIESGNKLLIEIADGRKFHSEKVIICIPPQLASSKIKFIPQLPDSLRDILPGVQTWMAGALKFTLEYEEPFWRNQGYSGMLYSHAGIIIEMYDHTNYEENKYGFTGFLNGGAASYSKEVRQEFVLKQLGELLGEKAINPVAYFDKVWADEFILDGNPIIVRPHQNNGHPLLQRAYMNGKLYFCGTESATKFPGYMEGAVVTAKEILSKI